MKPNAPVLRIALLLCAVGALPASNFARADATIRYRVEGTCNGDFDEVQLKEHWMRADSSQGGASGSMIYDGAEKLGYFIDHGSRTFMEVEMDEDAVDLQKDVMASLEKNMKHRTGMDPFATASSLCPGLADVDNRDRQPDEPIDCGNGATIGTNAPAANNDQMAAMMKNGQVQGMDADSQAMLQKMMEQQMAHLPPEQQAQMRQMLGHRAGSAAPGGSAPSAAPPRIDRDAGEIVVDGVTCMRREHLRGETMLREDCYATVSTLKLEDVEARRLTRFSKSLQQWSQAMAPPGLGAKRDKVDDRVLMRRTCYDAGRESGRATLTIERTPIAGSRFAVPAGYTPMDMGMQDLQGPGRR